MGGGDGRGTGGLLLYRVEGKVMSLTVDKTGTSLRVRGGGGRWVWPGEGEEESERSGRERSTYVYIMYTLFLIYS